MTPRERLAHTYRNTDVPGAVILGTLAVWLLVGVPVGLHFAATDLATTEVVFVGWVSGGFASAFLYILLACD